MRVIGAGIDPAGYFPGMTTRVLPIADHLIPGFRSVLDVVARERKYLMLVEAPPEEMVRRFVESSLAAGGVNLVAVNANDEVLGWCDIIRHSFPGTTHVGRLGMGVVAQARGKGLGERLARAAVAAALNGGIHRVELEVFSSNTAAVRLYDKMGFTHEGVRRAARKLDGITDDILLMAYFGPDGHFNPSASPG